MEMSHRQENKSPVERAASQKTLACTSFQSRKLFTQSSLGHRTLKKLIFNAACSLPRDPVWHSSPPFPGKPVYLAPPLLGKKFARNKNKKVLGTVLLSFRGWFYLCGTDDFFLSSVLMIFFTRFGKQSASD